MKATIKRHYGTEGGVDYVTKSIWFELPPSKKTGPYGMSAPIAYFYCRFADGRSPMYWALSSDQGNEGKDFKRFVTKRIWDKAYWKALDCEDFDSIW